MTLRQALEKKRDELALEHKHEFEKSNASFRAGADTMLSLLWPCVEALQLAYKAHWTNPPILEMEAALTQLRRNLGESNE